MPIVEKLPLPPVIVRLFVLTAEAPDIFPDPVAIRLTVFAFPPPIPLIGLLSVIAPLPAVFRNVTSVPCRAPVKVIPPEAALVLLKSNV